MWVRSLYYVWKSFRNLSDRESLDLFQERQFKNILATAEKISFYKDHVSGDNVNGTDSIDKLPILDSSNFRQRTGEMREVLESNPELSRHTSGTGSGSSTKIRFTERSHDWLSAVYFRTLYLQGYSFGKTIVQFWEDMEDQRSILGRLMMPKSYIETDKSIREQIQRLEDSDAEVLHYFPQMLLSVAKLSEKDDCDISPNLILTYGGNLTPVMRDYIGRVFNVEIRDQYNTTEFGVIAWECPEGGYHIAEDAVYPEIVDENKEPVSEGEVGRLILTGLVNDATPLIRYDTGDLVERSSQSCSCNTCFTKIKKVVGRSENAFINSEDEVIYPNQVIEVIAGEEDILFYQLVAKEEDYKLKFVPNKNCADKSLQNVKDRLREELSIRPVTLEETDYIPRSNGKLSVIENKQSTL